MSRKVINIISPHYSSGFPGEYLRIETAAKTLSSSFRVNVFALASKENNNKNYLVKTDEYLTIHYIQSHSYNKFPFIFRSIIQFYYSVRLLYISNSCPADLTIVSGQFLYLLLLFGVKCNSKKIIADTPDLAWCYLPASSLLQKVFNKRITTKVFHSLQKFNAITVSNETEKKWLIDFGGMEESKINVISNGIDSEKFKQLSELKYTPHQNQFVISYIGDTTSRQKFYSMINAVNEMKDVRFNIIGDGDELKSLQNYVQEKKISNVFIHGKLRWSRVLPYYQTSDLLFISLNDSFNTSIPFNLYENLSTGLPVLYQGNGAAIGLLKKFKNTFIFPDDDVKELEKVIWKIKRLSLSRSRTSSLIAGKFFIREKLSIQFAELSARLLNEKVLSEVCVEDVLMTLDV